MKVAPICHLCTLTSHFYAKPFQYVPFLTKTNRHRKKTKLVEPFYKVFNKFPTAKQKQSLLQGKHFQSKRDCLHTPLFPIVDKLCFPIMNCKAIEKEWPTHAEPFWAILPYIFFFVLTDCFIPMHPIHCLKISPC